MLSRLKRRFAGATVKRRDQGLCLPPTALDFAPGDNFLVCLQNLVAAYKKRGSAAFEDNSLGADMRRAGFIQADICIVLQAVFAEIDSNDPPSLQKADAIRLLKITTSEYLRDHPSSPPNAVIDSLLEQVRALGAE